MNPGENKRQRRYRESGLTFIWRMPDSSRGVTILATLVLAAAATVLLGGVKVRVVQPPRVIERSAAVVVVPAASENDRAWSLRAEEEGPFPARFHLSESEPVQDLQRVIFQHPAAAVPYHSQLRELPAVNASAGLNAAPAGERIFPALELPEPSVKPATEPPLRPVLSVLTQLPADSLPTTFPGFSKTVDSELAGQNWQFMMEIGEHGHALRCIALDGGETGAGDEAWVRELGDWLCQVQFGPAAANLGWIGVEISFSRQP